VKKACIVPEKAHWFYCKRFVDTFQSVLGTCTCFAISKLKSDVA
jgi:hypothetical protein